MMLYEFYIFYISLIIIVYMTNMTVFALSLNVFSIDLAVCVRHMTIFILDNEFVPNIT